jgi:hypothetical protein
MFGDDGSGAIGVPNQAHDSLALEPFQRAFEPSVGRNQSRESHAAIDTLNWRIQIDR